MALIKAVETQHGDNMRPKSVKVWELMARESFMRGYREVRAGLPCNGDAFEVRRDQQTYERGRQFAHCFKGRFMFNGKASKPAMLAYINARNRGDIR